MAADSYNGGRCTSERPWPGSVQPACFDRVLRNSVARVCIFVFCTQAVVMVPTPPRRMCFQQVPRAAVCEVAFVKECGAAVFSRASGSSRCGTATVRTALYITPHAGQSSGMRESVVQVIGLQADVCCMFCARFGVQELI